MTHIRSLFGKSIINAFNPEGTKFIMYLLTGTPGMVAVVEEVSFRFTQIEPPTCHAVAGVAFIKFAHPRHSVLVGSID